MKIHYKTILIVIFSLFVQNSFSQNWGYGYDGKKYLLKADLLNGKKSVLSGISIETILFQRSTISGGLTWIRNSNTEQLYSTSDYESGTPDKKTEMKDDAEVEERSINIEYRYYLGSLPAPNGLHLYGRVTFGQLFINGQYYSTINDTYESREYVDYNYDGLKFTSFSGGMGYQKFIYKSNISLGAHIGFVYTKAIPGLVTEFSQKVSGVTRNYGSNLKSFEPKDESEVHTNFGMQAFVQLGFLIF